MTTLSYRDATVDDLAFIVGIIAGDAVADTPDRSDEPDHPRYLAALAAIAADPAQRLVVAEFNGRPAGTLQLTFIPGIARLGETRCLIEAVHVAPDLRSQGLGGQMIRWAIAEARAHGCGLVQL